MTMAILLKDTVDVIWYSGTSKINILILTIVELSTFMVSLSILKKSGNYDNLSVLCLCT